MPTLESVVPAPCRMSNEAMSEQWLVFAMMAMGPMHVQHDFALCDSELEAAIKATEFEAAGFATRTYPPSPVEAP